jgi:hypothetical protein
MVKPKSAGLRPVVDLAKEGDRCTPQAIYGAVRRGWLPVTTYGKLQKITQEAYDFHDRFGWGPGVPRHGTAEAVAYQRQRDAEEAAARAAEAAA